MLTVLRRLCGHRCGGPSAVRDQSISRMRPPISPPPARNVSVEGSIEGAFIREHVRTFYCHSRPPIVRLPPWKRSLKQLPHVRHAVTRSYWTRELDEAGV